MKLLMDFQWSSSPDDIQYNDVKNMHIMLVNKALWSSYCDSESFLKNHLYTHVGY